MPNLPERTAKPLEVGVILRAHGLRGDVRVRLHWAGSDTLENVPAVLLRSDKGLDVSYVVQSARRSPQGLLLKLDGVGDRDAADALRGARVLVAREYLPPMQEGEFFLTDLVGATVRCGDEVIGVVESIRVHPSVDCLVILSPQGKRLEQPVVEHWLESVNVDQGEIVLATRDGLID